MRNEASGSLSWRRTLVLACIGALGVVTIVGSGGGGDAPECSFFSNTCNPVIGPIPPIPVAEIDPQRKTVQVGASVTFTVQSSGIGQPSYRWQRTSDGGRTFVDIAGATGSSYTLVAANLADDATDFWVTVSGNGGVALARAHLAVSSTPGLVFQDGEFLPADWLVAATADPVQNGPVHSEERAAAGGNPDAYRAMMHTMSPGPSALTVFHTLASATYDPGAQGAIYVIDYVEDCIRPGTSTSDFLVASNLLLEQAGRRYIGPSSRFCGSVAWSAMPPWAALGVADFALLEGPACGAGQSCPDFSASAQPIRFGFVRRAVVSARFPAGTIVHGIDNWKVTVWRR